MAEEDLKKAEADTGPGPSSVTKSKLLEEEKPVHDDAAEEKVLNPVDQSMASRPFHFFLRVSSVM